MMRLNYIVIPLFVVATAGLGSWFTNNGLYWYSTIKIPSWTPSGGVIGAVWTILFILATISALVSWNSEISKARKILLAKLFVINTVLNFGWSFIFFEANLLLVAVFEAIFLELSVLSLIIFIRGINRFASLLLIPYALWVGFATNLTFSVWLLNK